jgi:hypothetical protein
MIIYHVVFQILVKHLKFVNANKQTVLFKFLKECYLLKFKLFF